MLYMETGSTEPSFNLAFEEYVLCRRTEGDYLLLWQNDSAVIIGQNQNTLAEIDPDFVAAHGIRVVRRSTGGGAVYHDLGNLNYSFITDAGNAAELSMQRFTRPVVEALCSLGLRAEASGRNDILVEGRKVSGTAQRLYNGRVLHHGTLLFRTDGTMLAGALRADPEKFRSKSTKSVRSRVGNLCEYLPDMDLPAFWRYLKDYFAAGDFRETSLTPEELAAVEELREKKYAAWEWNYGASPAFNFSRRRRWEGGTLEVQAEVREGRISHVGFYGDFLSVTSLDALREALTGIPFDRPSFAAVLSAFPAGQYFGSIRQEEVLATVFDDGQGAEDAEEKETQS